MPALKSLERRTPALQQAAPTAVLLSYETLRQRRTCRVALAPTSLKIKNENATFLNF